jgi:dienelactone hydrolase
VRQHKVRTAAMPVLATLMLATALSACSTVSAAAVSVRPLVSLADQAVTIRVTGLVPGELATVQVRSTDASDVRWQSSASYRVGAGGELDLDRAPALSGSYLGVSGMGPIWSMQPEGPDPAGGYFWNAEPLTFTVSVSVGRERVAAASFQRKFSSGPLTAGKETLAADGFIGSFWRPAVATARRPAVMVLGGSGGGLPVRLPALLASSGYPALGVAYFKEPGLPQTLSDIPLEYFARALTWLARQPGVDPARIAVLGVSRGSEAAQLLGVYYPGLVHAVIASVPSNSAICSYPGCTGPAWTLHGRALPYTRQFDNPSPTDAPAAVIPDQRIRGPVFLDCGSADATWVSCAYAQAIMRLLDSHHDTWTHVLYAYSDAGHDVGSFSPYEPAVPADATWSADQEAQPFLWQHLLAFLAGLVASPPT